MSILGLGITTFMVLFYTYEHQNHVSFAQGHRKLQLLLQGSNIYNKFDISEDTSA